MRGDTDRLIDDHDLAVVVNDAEVRNLDRLNDRGTTWLPSHFEPRVSSQAI